MPSKVEILILAQARQHIEDYLSESYVPEKLQHTLHNFQERIRAIEHVITTWNKADGHIARAKNFNKEFTQQELLTEYVDRQKGVTEFSLRATNNLIKEFDELIATNKLAKIDEFMQAKKCIQSVFEVLQSPQTESNSVHSLMVDNNLAYQPLANMLGARYLPLSQVDDPLRGKVKTNNNVSEFEGMCHGNVMEWRDEIIQKEGYLITPHYNQRVHRYQKSALKINDQLMPVTSIHTFEKFLHSKIDRMKPGYVYELVHYGNVEGHATGIALYSSGEVEFFDSNQQLIIFPDVERFNIWLSLSLPLIYEKFFNDNGKAVLIEIGKLPKKSKPSIPKMKDSASLIDNAIFEVIKRALSNVKDADSIFQAMRTVRHCLQLHKSDQDKLACIYADLEYIDTALGGDKVFDGEEVSEDILLRFQHKLLQENAKILNKNDKLSLKEKGKVRQLTVEQWISDLQKKKRDIKNENSADKINYYLALAYLDLAKPHKEKAIAMLNNIKSMAHFSQAEQDKIKFILKHQVKREWFRFLGITIKGKRINLVDALSVKSKQSNK